MILPPTTRSADGKGVCFLADQRKDKIQVKPLHYSTARGGSVPQEDIEPVRLALIARGMFCPLDADGHCSSHGRNHNCAEALLALCAEPMSAKTIQKWRLRAHLNCSLFRDQVMELVAGATPPPTWTKGKPGPMYSKRCLEARNILVRQVKTWGLAPAPGAQAAPAPAPAPVPAPVAVGAGVAGVPPAAVPGMRLTPGAALASAPQRVVVAGASGSGAGAVGPLASPLAHGVRTLKRDRHVCEEEDEEDNEESEEDEDVDVDLDEEDVEEEEQHWLDSQLASRKRVRHQVGPVHDRVASLLHTSHETLVDPGVPTATNFGMHHWAPAGPCMEDVSTDLSGTVPDPHHLLSLMMPSMETDEEAHPATADPSLAATPDLGVAAAAAAAAAANTTTLAPGSDDESFVLADFDLQPPGEDGDDDSFLPNLD